MTNTPHDVWLTLPQTAAYLDLAPDDALWWIEKRGILTNLTGTDTTPDRNRAHRFKLSDIDNAARARGARRARDVYPDRVIIRTGQLAAYLGIPHRTLNDWIASGRVTPTGQTPGQRHALFTLADAIELATHTKETTRV